MVFPAIEGRLGIVDEVQDLSPNPFRRCSGGASRHQGRFLFLCTSLNQFHACNSSSYRNDTKVTYVEPNLPFLVDIMDWCPVVHVDITGTFI
jgi:hypothetical protein